MLIDLPEDLLLAIVFNLALSDIANLRRVSKSWNSLVDRNEFAVFHTAAVLNFHVPPSAKLLQDLQHTFSPRALNGVSTWNELCRRLLEINKSWNGTTPSTITSHKHTGNSQVHRFKVDEHVGLIIATSASGGLTVTDLNASKWYDGRVSNTPEAARASAILWELPKNCVRPYAHCEYGHGYLIFDRFGGSKEVWRLADYDYYYPPLPSSSDVTPTPPPNVAPEVAPDFIQKRAAERARARHNIEQQPDREGELPPPTRGHLVPWALLRPEDHTRAFRFVYPILLVASFTTAYLYDVRTGFLIQEIQNLQFGQPPEDDDEDAEFTEPFLGELSYVEHCPQYLFICGETCLRVFSRQSGQWMYDIPAIQDSYGRSRWKISSQQDDCPRSLNCIRSRIDNDLHTAWNETGSVFYRHEVVVEAARQHRPPVDNPIVAAHVSSCGNYLAVLLRTSRVLIIRNLERLFRGDLSLSDCTVEVQLGRDARVSRYHAFENGRVGIANRNGIFVVIPDPSFFSPEPISVSSPPTVLRVHPLNDPLGLDSVSCLQMTQTGLFINWVPQCPVTGQDPEHSDDDRIKIYTDHEGLFWSQLAQSLTYGQELAGHMFLEEDEESRTSSDGIVLSVDFVQT